jgi:ABC-type bacteriocin/lantibiotic exporter with double-glycine peptidase domain
MDAAPAEPQAADGNLPGKPAVEALKKLQEGRTSFVIAHRLSTIRNAHQILVINNGGRSWSGAPMTG